MKILANFVNTCQQETLLSNSKRSVVHKHKFNNVGLHSYKPLENQEKV